MVGDLPLGLMDGAYAETRRPLGRRRQGSSSLGSSSAALALGVVIPVSYTHLTLPTICSV